MFLDAEGESCHGTEWQLFLALHQRELRSKLDVNHHADAAVELKECGRFLPGEHSSHDRHIFLAKLGCGNVGVQPAANQIVGLLIG